MAGLNDLFESIVSMAATLGGKAAAHGGKSCMLSVGRKIGWASKEGLSSGRGLKNHSIGSGFAGTRKGALGKYDPTMAYKSAALSGSGLGQKLLDEKKTPDKLFGRTSFHPSDKPKFEQRSLGSSRHQNFQEVVGLLNKTKLR